MSISMFMYIELLEVEEELIDKKTNQLVCIYMYVYVYIYVYVYRIVRGGRRIDRLKKRICWYVHIYVCIYFYIYTYKCSSISIHTCIQSDKYVYINIVDR
jgi:hypothetical protein